MAKERARLLGEHPATRVVLLGSDEGLLRDGRQEVANSLLGDVIRLERLRAGKPRAVCRDGLEVSDRRQGGDSGLFLEFAQGSVSCRFAWLEMAFGESPRVMPGVP